MLRSTSVIELEIDAETPPPESSKNRCVYARGQKMQSDGEKLYPKPHQNVSKNRMKILDFDANGSPKINQNDAQERSERDLGSKLVLDFQKVQTPYPFWIPFGRSWTPSWAPLGAKGSQNRAFWHQDTPKFEMLIEFWSENVSF